MVAKLDQGHMTGSRDIKNGMILSGQALYNFISEGLPVESATGDLNIYFYL
jgi:hypothetical protein